MKNTYFLFQGRYYEQLEGAAMGPPISPIMESPYMEDFDIKDLSTINQPLLWGKDMLMILL